MRLFFAMGPGDIVSDERERMVGLSGARETSITFTEQISAYCRFRNFPALLVASHLRSDEIKRGCVTLLNLPNNVATVRGVRYHLKQVGYALKLALLARKFGAELALIDTGTVPIAYLVAFKVFGIDVAINMHNVRWAQGYRARRSARALLDRLDSAFLRYATCAIMGCSPECGVQAQADGADRLPFYLWFAQYRRQGFGATTPPSSETFRVIFAGRVELNKGALDLVAIAEAVGVLTSRPILVEICGDGSALEVLRSTAAQSPAAARLRIHGRLGRAQLLAVYARAHAAIVPTRSEFCEGMPLVCAEAVISGKPVVTSRLSNALPVIGAAALEVEPENINDYAAAIVRLATDPECYSMLQAGCAQASRQFFNRSLGIASALDSLLTDRNLTLKRLDKFEVLYD